MSPARPFVYHGTQLCAGPVPLARLARRFGTPLYVYDFDAIHAAFTRLDRAFGAQPHLVCAAVKANGNLALLRRLAAWGSGFDVVSGGELERVLRAGGSAARVVFSGVGKTAAEIDAGLRAGILLFHVESEAELELLAERAARLRRRARFGVRVNPDVAAPTHPHIATGQRGHKFGLAPGLARRLYLRPPTRWLTPEGISFHIGSQILDAAPFAEAARRVGAMAADLRRQGVPIRYFDIGGGLGIAYRAGERPPTLRRYVAAIRAALAGAGLEGVELLLEPGRRLVAAAGALLARVLYVKENAGKRFLIIDAASNDLLRPSLYGAYHEIFPLARRRGARRRVDVVGPICESGDVLAENRALAAMEPGELLAVLDAGAYGFTLSSNYNARPRAAEVAIEGGRARCIRRRETVADMLRPEIGHR